MKVSITHRHMPMTDRMRQYAEERATRLGKYFDRVLKLEVILSHEKERHIAEVIATTAHGEQLVGHAVKDDMCAALDIATDKLERQIVKVKEKLRGARAKRARGRTKGAEAPATVEAPEEVPEA